jgi:uncharacterized membrane protein YjgN (DUF898 family)
VSETAFKFHGTGKEFFRIWIVNLSLSIITFGIYSAWAKVRTSRYFYSHTEYQGHRFSYLASPIAILKGRIVALIFFAAYILLSQYSPKSAVIVIIVFMLALPWIIYRSLRFNARVSQYRNIRFDFVGDAWGAAKAFIFWSLLGIITLGFMMPFADKAQTRYIAGNHKYGDLPFNNTCLTGGFYIMFFVTILISLIFFGVLFGVVAIYPGFEVLAELGKEGSDPTEAAFLAPIFFVAYIVFILIITAYRTATYTNIFYNSTDIDGKHHFGANFKTMHLIGIYLKYSILMALTLGFAWPWFKVALAKYTADHITLALEGGLDDVADDAEMQGSAIGDELGDAFDVGAGVF